jgi:hypothetical protein
MMVTWVAVWWCAIRRAVAARAAKDGSGSGSPPGGKAKAGDG